MDLSYNLLINGVAQNSSITNKIMFFMISDNEGAELNNLILTLNNADNQIIPPNSKANIELIIGFGNPVSTGNFIVQFVEYNEGTVTLKGVSQDLTLARVKQTRVFENQTLSAVLNTMANNLGLSLKLGNSLSNKQIPYLLQSNQSDLSLLAELGELYYAVANIKNNELVFIAKDATQEVILLANDSEVFVINHKDTEYKIYNGVKAYYWDFKTANQKEITLGSAPYLIVSNLYCEELTKELVKSKYKEIKEKQILELVIKGNPSLQAGLLFKIPKKSKYQDSVGDYRITKVKHTYNETGYLSYVTAYRL